MNEADYILDRWSGALARMAAGPEYVPPTAAEMAVIVREALRWRGERDLARATNTRLNRRCQELQRAVNERLDAARPWGPSVGRALLAAGFRSCREELARIGAAFGIPLLERRGEVAELASLAAQTLERRDGETIAEAATRVTRALRDVRATLSEVLDFLQALDLDDPQGSLNPGLSDHAWASSLLPVIRRLVGEAGTPNNLCTPDARS